jgi:hypothetical protein
VFDVAGILLFSVEPVRMFFSKYLILMDWSLQPAITYPRGDIHNVGNYYAARFPLPFYKRLSLFGYEGYSSLGGLSFDIDDEYTISAGAGGKVSRFQNGARDAVLNQIDVAPAGALFLDRKRSLLFSVVVADVQDYFIHVNLYPNAFLFPGLGLGVFGVLAQPDPTQGNRLKYQIGLSYTKALGVGVGAGTL